MDWERFGRTQKVGREQRGVEVQFALMGAPTALIGYGEEEEYGSGTYWTNLYKIPLLSQSSRVNYFISSDLQKPLFTISMIFWVSSY